MSGTNSVPPGLYPDEAINGNNASEALDTGNFKVFYPENNGREGLFINIQAVFIKVFSNEPWVLRLPSAIFGILTILGIYLFSATLFNNASIGLLSSFFTAISFWHINFSRIGFRAIMAPFLLVWALYFLIKSLNSIQRKSDFIEVQPPKYYHRFLRRLNLAKFEGKLSFQKLKIKKWTLPALAGFVYGLGFYTYIAYRGTPLLILCIFYYYYKYCRQNHSHILQNVRMIFLVFAIAAIFAILPLGIYFINHPQDFLGRAAQISVFSSTSPIKDLGLNILKTAGMFNFSGDTNWRHNFAGKPELYWPVGIMFVFGILYGLWQIIKNLKPFSVIASAAKAISSVIPHLMRNPEKELNSRCSLPSSHIGGGNDIRGFEFLILFSWLIITALPVVISNEGIPHALRSLLMIPPVFILAGVGALKIYELLINKIPGFYHRHDKLVKNAFILLCAF
ncbi:MAG: glycosyltransferase family 39 protein [Patescibacteria group bacterium]